MGGGGARPSAARLVGDTQPGRAPQPTLLTPSPSHARVAVQSPRSVTGSRSGLLKCFVRREHGPGGRRFSFCIGKDASQPQRSRFLMAAKPGGRDTMLLYLNSRCAGQPCARLRCNLFATQVRGLRVCVSWGVLGLRLASAAPACPLQGNTLQRLTHAHAAPSRPLPPCLLQYKLALSEDLQLEPTASTPGADGAAAAPSGSAAAPSSSARCGEFAQFGRLTSWSVEAAAEAAAAAQRLQQQRVEQLARSGAGAAGSTSCHDLPLEVDCFAELQYQARVKGFMQPRRCAGRRGGTCLAGCMHIL